MNVALLKIPTIVLAVVALVVGVSSGAVAAKLITSADVKDNSLKSVDIKNGTLGTKDLKQNAISGNRLQKGTVNGAKLQGGTVTGGKLADGAVTSGKIADGTIGPNDLSTTAFGPNWSIVDRNVIDNGDSYLRSGPSDAFGPTTVAPPFGIGSLGLRTGSPTDKAAFGDQVDFQGMDFSTITTLTYSSFTTQENIDTGGAAANLPSLEIEIDPNLDAVATNFSTAGFLPDAAANTPGWSDNDAIAAGQWFLTGTALGTATGCTLSTPCTWDALQLALDDGGDAPTIFTVEFSKGRDFAFSGAVDGLHIVDGASDQLVDFEPFGVTVTTQ